MNNHDLLGGIVIGAAVAGMIASVLWVRRDRIQGPLPVPPDDEPFRPLADLRLLRVCDCCRRYIGDSRTITSGQHLNLLPTICPRCTKRGAILNTKPFAA